MNNCIISTIRFYNVFHYLHIFCFIAHIFGRKIFQISFPWVIHWSNGIAMHFQLDPPAPPSFPNDRHCTASQSPSEYAHHTIVRAMFETGPDRKSRFAEVRARVLGLQGVFSSIIISKKFFFEHWPDTGTGKSLDDTSCVVWHFTGTWKRTKLFSSIMQSF